MLKIFSLIFLMLVSGCVSSHERLSFYKLIVSPGNYEGQDIYLTGYFVNDGTECLVISNNKETSLMYREYEMVKLCKNNLADIKDFDLFRKLVNKYGAVAGNFSSKKCGESMKVGSSLNYLGCLTRIDVLHGPIHENGPAMPPPPVS